MLKLISVACVLLLAVFTMGSYQASCGGGDVDENNCEDLGGSCESYNSDPTFGVDCEDLGMYNMPGGSCGGVANLSCCAKTCGFMACPQSPTGLECYDIEGDSCDPKKGGRDCPGYCMIP